jgi:lipid II isoglutaminyl synthase (glutamine-hydrolysing)
VPVTSAPSIALARTVGRLSRRLGRGGGTSAPGKVLLKMRPEAVRELGARLAHGAAVVSATNGKTTTTRLLAACLQASGRRVVSNPAGANLLSGVTTALLDGTAGRDRSGTTGLFEVDEFALPEVVRQLRPDTLLLMNLFRDQLDRYGELEAVADAWTRMVAGLPAGTTLVLNADDPAVAALGTGRPGTVYFGIDDPAVALAELPHASDSTRCRACGRPLDYARATLGHMGHWACACGVARPSPGVRATRVLLDGTRGLRLTLGTPGGEAEIAVALPGVHNAYNATAAVAAALAMGVPLATAARAVEGADAAFGRAERVTVGGREVVLLLAKNPAGANTTVQTVLLDPQPLHLLVALNDRTADGHDVSWIWDVDYEPLLERTAGLTVTGDRAHDMALRFVYAGLPRDRVRVLPDPEAALDAAVAEVPAGVPLYVLPTYTAMLGLREVLVRRGAATEFWRDR